MRSEEKLMMQQEQAAPAVTVYSKPACVQCQMTYRFLDQQGITYRVVDVTENQAALEYVTEDLKYSSAPVVVVDDQNHWAGFRPDLLGTLPVQA